MQTGAGLGCGGDRDRRSPSHGRDLTQQCGVGEVLNRRRVRANFLKKALMLGKIEGGRKGAQQRMRWLDGITDSWT